MKVLVLGGGDSPERNVSLRSAKAVANAARAAGLKVSEADPKDGLQILEGLSKDTAVFPILHGTGGEDGSLQAELERRNLAFLGSDSQSSKKCFDKWDTLNVLRKVGLPTSESALVNKDTYPKHELSSRAHVLKVRRGGSSIGTLIVRNREHIDQKQVDKIFELETEAVVEALIEGTEVTVPILDQSALPVIEIRPPEGQEFDYDNKYNGLSAEICPPEKVSNELQKQVQKISEKVHRAMDCRHMSRVDIMIDQSGKLFVLEINTIPGLTSQSLFPKSAAVAGLAMPELIKKFADLIKRDYNL